MQKKIGSLYFLLCALGCSVSAADVNISSKTVNEIYTPLKKGYESYCASSTEKPSGCQQLKSVLDSLNELQQKGEIRISVDLSKVLTTALCYAAPLLAAHNVSLNTNVKIDDDAVDFVIKPSLTTAEVEKVRDDVKKGYQEYCSNGNKVPYCEPYKKFLDRLDGWLKTGEIKQSQLLQPFYEAFFIALAQARAASAKNTSDPVFQISDRKPAASKK